MENAFSWLRGAVSIDSYYAAINYNLCTSVLKSRLLTVFRHSVLNMKVLVGNFNQEKALAGAFSVIMNLRVD